jgi:LEA14-like dessication related protein
MTLKIRFTYVLVIVLLGTIGLGIYLFIEKQKMLNLILPEMTEITLIKADIHSDTIFVEVHAIVVNRAPFSMNIDSIVCDLALGGTKLVSTSQYVGVRQLIGESDTVMFSVKVPISLTRNKIVSLQSQDSTGVTIDATIIYSGYKLKLAKGKTIGVPVPPELRVIKTEQKKLSLLKKDVKVDLYLEVINEGKNLSLDISDLQYELTIGNDLYTKGNYPKDIYIRPRSSVILKFPLDFSMKNPMKTILKVWADNDRVPFKLMLSGYIYAGKMKRIPVVIFTSGQLEIVNEQKKKSEKKAEKARKKKRRKARKLH